MKLSRKVLAGLSAAALLAFAIGCKNEDDDPAGAISGNSVYYDNTNGYEADTADDAKVANTKGTYRAWSRTTLKHLGGLTKITLKKGDTVSGKDAGVMGFAWDLQTNNGSDGDDSSSETFNVVGVRNDNGTLRAYVSRYFNVSNKQANNFGATTLAKKGSDAAIAYSDVDGKTVEWDISNGWIDFGTISTSNETTSIWVDVAIVPPSGVTDADKDKCCTPSTRKLPAYFNAAAGSWFVAFYSESPKDKTGDNVLTPLATVLIPAATDSSVGSGYSQAANATVKSTAIDLSKCQKKQAWYANIYKGHILSGTWDAESTYFQDEAIEE